MTKEDIEKASIHHANMIGWDHDPEEIRRLFAYSFRAGNNWRINSVWHDAKESPVKTGSILVRFKHDFRNQSDCEVWIIKGTDISAWDELIEANFIVEYAYIEDLLPNKED